jgi:hypothetical protein
MKNDNYKLNMMNFKKILDKYSSNNTLTQKQK